MIKDYILYLIRHYGQLFLFISLMLEFFGLPVPTETSMTFMGYLIYRQGGHALYSSIIISSAGTVTGASLAYLIGSRYGKDVILKYGRYVHITEDKLDKTIQLFNRRRVLLLLFSRFVPGARHLVPYISGMSKMNFTEFLGYNTAGSLIWSSIFILQGYILGERWTIVERIVKAYSFILLLLAVFVYIVYRYFNRHKWVIFAISFPILLFIKLAEDLIKEELSVFDNEVYQFIAGYISGNMTEFMKIATFLGSGITLVIISVIILITLWNNKDYSFYGRMILANLTLSALLNQGFKVLFHRPRPEVLRFVEISGYSFPSGHSMTGMSFYGFLIFLCLKHMKRKYKYLIAGALCLLVITIGISRIYLGVHYASDVLAGFSAGLAWLAVFITVINRIDIMRIFKRGRYIKSR